METDTRTPYFILLFPYASQPLNISVKADETSQSETSESSSSENTPTEVQTTEPSDYNSAEPFPTYQNSGTLSDMIGQVFPTAPSVSSVPSASVIPKKSTAALTADGITINGKFYSNETFNQLLQKGYLLPNAPVFVIDASGKLDVPLEPRFAMALVPLYFVPGLGQIALAGTAIVLGGILIYEGTQAYNNVTARLNAAQKAKLATAKAKADAEKKTRLKKAAKSWEKGSFKSPEDSLDHHAKKHGKEVGASNEEEYARKAEEFARTAKKGSSKSEVKGATKGTIRYKKNGRYIDLAPSGKIVSFGSTGR